nr:MAG TPA: hypothetical protein [Caudoviricetes sp.]
MIWLSFIMYCDYFMLQRYHIVLNCVKFYNMFCIWSF